MDGVTYQSHLGNIEGQQLVSLRPVALLPFTGEMEGHASSRFYLQLQLICHQQLIGT